MATIGSLAVNIIARTQQFNTGVAKVRHDVRGLSAVTTSATGITGGFATKLAALSGVAVVAGTAITRVAGAAEQFAQNLAQSTAIMGNITDKTRDQMTQTALDVARTTTFSAAEVAKAYYYLASAGLDAEQSIAAMPQVARFAQAGMFDLSRATDLATDAQSALGLTVEDSQQNLANLKLVTDTLVKANTLANASVEQFSTALTNKAGAAMKSLGMDISEGVAVLAALADQGVKAEEAGTAFGIVIRDLTTKALQNAEAFQTAGVAVYDSNSEFRNMADIVLDLENALAGLSDAQAKATLLQLGFADKSVSFIQTLIGTSEKIREYENSLKSAGGITQAVADRNLTPMQKAWARLSASIDEMTIGLSPFINSLAAVVAVIALITGGVLEWVRNNASLASSLVSVEVVAFTAGLIGVLVVIPKMVSGCVAIARALTLWGIQQRMVLALSGPAGWAMLVAGIAAGTAAAYLASKQFDELTTKLELNGNQTVQVAKTTDQLKRSQMEIVAAFSETESATGGVNEAQDKFNQLLERGRQLTERLRTPLEVYKDSIREYMQLAEVGKISQETFNRAIADAGKAYKDATAARNEFENPNRNVSAAVKGTSAGFEAVQASQAEMKRLAELQRQQVAEQKQSNALLSDIRNQTRDPIEVTEHSF